jgi:ABC-2 type transport system ATP-binding protein
MAAEDLETPDEAEPPAGPVLEVLNLTHDRVQVRRFQRLRRARPPIRALSDVSFTIMAGEAVGCLGARGSGKTTLLELLTGILTATDGLVRTCGRSPVTARDELAHRIGVVLGDRPQLWPDLSLAESLRILAQAHDLPERRWLPRRTELIDGLELADFLDLPAQQLSPGRRRRAEVAAALLHEPELVLVDQPTLDLDVRSKELLRSFLRHEHRVHGRTVLVTGADLGDVEQFCDRLLVIDHGRLAYDGDLAGLIGRAGGQRVLVVDLLESGQMLDDVPGTSLFAVEADGLRQRLSFSPADVSTASVLAEVTSRTGVRDLRLEDQRLMDVVHRLRFPQQLPEGS